MQENLEQSLNFILSDEGGFALRAAEPGGSVNKGISMLVFDEWRVKQGKKPPSVDALRALSTAEAKEIYTEKFWTPLHGNDLPTGLDYAMLNTAVMEGVVGAVSLLQESMGLVKTGHYNDVTWATLAKSDPKITTLELLVHHLNKKLHALSASKYGIGWGDRIVRVKNRAMEMMR